MTVYHRLRFFVLLSVLITLPTIATAATSELRVLFNADNNTATGCAVGEMAGVDQILVTEISINESSANVVRTYRLVCDPGTLAFGEPLDSDTTGWPAVVDPETETVSIETRIPFSAFQASGLPVMRLGFVYSTNAGSQVLLTGPGNSPVVFPPAPAGRRRAVQAGDPRAFVLDGNLAEWGTIAPMVTRPIGDPDDGNFTKAFAFANSPDSFLYLALSTGASIGPAPIARNDEYPRQQGQPLAVNNPNDGVLKNDDGLGEPITAEKVAEPTHGAVALNPDGTFVYTPTNPASKENDHFEYKAVNGSGVRSTAAKVTIQVNDRPKIKDAVFTIPENATNGTVVGVILVTDESSDDHTFQIVSGNTGGAFAINVLPNGDGELVVANQSAINFESNPTFNLNVKVTDEGGLSDTGSVKVNVTNVNEAPAAANSNQNVAEDALLNGSLSASDPENNTLTYSQVAGPLHGILSINPATGAYTYDSDADYFGPDSFTWRVNDGSLDSNTATVSINVTAVNDPPSFATGGNVASPEDTPYSQTWPLSVSVGPANEAGQGYEFTVNNDAPGLFLVQPSISGSGDAIPNVLTFTPALNASGTANVTVQMFDDGGGTNASGVVNFQITITAVNDAPVVNAATFNLDENSANGTVVGTATFTDADSGQTHVFSITAGNTGGAFAINAATGQITVADATALNYETTPSFSLQVTVTDNSGAGNAAGSNTVTVNLNNVNEAPVASDATFNLDENSANGTGVGTVTATDPDAGQTLAYAITAGNTGGAFAINPTTGAITVADVTDINYEVNPTFSLTVTVTDNGTGNLADTAAITVNLNNLNEAPAVNAATFGLDENSANGTSVGTVTFTDADTTGQTHSFAITGGNALGAFAINPSTGEITVADVTDLDFETNPTFNLTVEVTDAGAPTPNLSGSATITINLNDVNDAPVVNDQGFNVDENSANGTGVGTVAATDADAGQTLSYAITGGNALGAFTINPGTGAITVADTTDLDFETNPSFSLTVQVTDNGTGNLTDTATITITVNDVNEAPAIVTPLAPSNVTENAVNGTSVTTVVANDADASQTQSWAITAGNTGGAFAINPTTGEITIANSAAVDYETNPSFTLTVEVTDNGTPAASDTESIFINVNNVNEAPVVTADTLSVPENSPNGTTVGTVAFTDQDASQTGTFAITAGNTGNAFAIDPVTGEIRVDTVAAIDYETNPTFSLTVEVTDNGVPVLSGSGTITVNLTDANEAPVVNDQLFSVDENSANGAVVGTVAFSDPDGPADTFSITAGNGDGKFAIHTTTGQITVAGALNYEATNSYVLTVQVSDGGTPLGTDTAQITINVDNLNENPAVTAATFGIPENTANTTSVGTVGVTDPDPGDTHTFAITAGNTGGAFTINPTTGEITVANSAAVNFEATPTFSLTVEATDNGVPALSGSNTITINLSNVNDAPSDIALSNNQVAETAASGTAVGTLTTTDQDSADTHTYSLVAGAGDDDNAAFTISGNQLVTVATFDFETDASYTVRVRTTDSGTGNLTYDEVFTIAIVNANEQPAAVNLSANTVAENQPSGTAVGTLTTTDPDTVDSHTYMLVSGTGSADNGSFQIVGDQLQTAASFDLETQGTYTIRVRSTDSGSLTAEQQFTITVTNDNEAPTDIALDNDTVAENQAIGTPVGNLTTTDPDAGDSHTYSLVTGTGDADNGKFSISGGQLVTNAILDFDAQQTYSVRLRTTDAGLLTYDEVFTVNVIDANDTPTDIVLDNASVAENQPIGTAVGNFTTTDQDAGDTHTYMLAAGTGDADNLKFQIVGDQLRTAAILDFEGQPSYSIRVRTTDSGPGNLTYDEVFTISATDANEAPTDITLSANTVAENQPSNTPVGNLTSTDQDAGATHTYMLVNGTGDADNASFQIVGNQLRTNASFNFEADSSYSVRIQSTDDDGLTYAEAFTVTITDVNEAPVLPDATRDINENSPNGTNVGAVLPFTEPDGGQSHTFAITAGNASGAFAINNSGQITVADVTDLNFEVTPQFILTVQVTDNGTPTLSDTATVTIDINNVNEAPTAGTDAYNYIGNTELRIAGHAGTGVTALAFTTHATNPKANDTDPDSVESGFANLSIVAVAAGTSASGGTYRIEADGTMFYTPPAGHTLADSITYQLTDGTNVVNGTINFTMTGTDLVWYVKNDDPTADGAPAKDGTSSYPFNTLAGASGASDVNEIIYVHSGNGGTLGQNNGIVLKAGQKLHGQGIALVVNGATTLIGAGTQPQIGNIGGAGVTATNLPQTVEIRGLNIAGTTDAVSVSTNVDGSMNISNNTIRSAGNEGIDFDATSGAISLRISNNTITSTGTGIDVNQTGALTAVSIDAFADNTILGATAGAGVVVTNATFNAISAGAWAIGASGNGVGGLGMNLVNVNGSLSFTDLDIFADGGGALIADGASAGSLTLSVSPNAASLFATGGPAAEITDTALTLQVGGMASTNSSGNGVGLTRVTGTFSAPNTSTITNTAGIDFFITNSSADVTYAGTITDDVGQLITISSCTGTSTKAFTGAITDNDNGTGTGITLSGNSAQTTVRFSGGLVLSTGTAAAFSASGAGVLEICDEAGCIGGATGALLNKITTTTGTALTVSGVGIGASHLEFRSITAGTAASGPTNGISLNATGSAGGLKIVGTGSAGTGGTIQRTTGVGVLLIDTDHVNLNWMNILNSGDDGIRGQTVDNFTITNSNLTTNGNATAENGLQFGEATGLVGGITGTLNITNTNITGSAGNNVHIRNTSGTLTAMNVSGGSFDDLNDTTGANSFLFEMSGSATTTAATITGAGFDNNSPQRALEVQAHDTGTITNFTVSGSTFTNNGIHASFTQDTSANLKFSMLNNTTMTGADPLHAINVFSSSTSTGGTLYGTISGNVIGAAGAGSGSTGGHGIRVMIQGRTTGRFLINNNNITQTTGARPMLLEFLGAIASNGGVGVVSTNDVTITNNTIQNHMTTFPGAALSLYVDDQGSGRPARVRADIRNNTVPNTGTYDYPTFDPVAGGGGAQLIFIENAAGAIGELVDTGAANATAHDQLVSTNTGKIYGHPSLSLIAGPINTP